VHVKVAESFGVSTHSSADKLVLSESRCFFRHE
jgi:hypothetical protein